MNEWEYARTLSVSQLYNYKGQVVPWPPSDDDIVWWGQAISQLHDYKDSLHPERQSLTRNWSNSPHVYGLLGECAFGLRFGLKKSDLSAWPRNLWYDFRFPLLGTWWTIDVKTRTQQTDERNVVLSLSKSEIKHKVRKGVPYCDIYVLAWLPTRELRMASVKLLGWAFVQDLLDGDEHDFTYEPGRGLTAEYLRPMDGLRKMIPKEVA